VRLTPGLSASARQLAAIGAVTVVQRKATFMPLDCSRRASIQHGRVGRQKIQKFAHRTDNL
jgi:hypothetical protein